jgi:hypothetical protein
MLFPAMKKRNVNLDEAEEFQAVVDDILALNEDVRPASGKYCRPSSRYEAWKSVWRQKMRCCIASSTNVEAQGSA